MDVNTINVSYDICVCTLMPFSQLKPVLPLISLWIFFSECRYSRPLRISLRMVAIWVSSKDPGSIFKRKAPFKLWAIHFTELVRTRNISKSKQEEKYVKVSTSFRVKSASTRSGDVITFGWNIKLAGNKRGDYWNGEAQHHTISLCYRIKLKQKEKEQKKV